MSLMSSLYTGTSGLQVAQNALNTTAHNMSNLDTEGYTRQQVQQGTRNYVLISKTNSAIAWQQTGLGVEYSNVKQVRHQFLDISYRLEKGREEFYTSSTECLLETADLLQEMNGAEFAESLNNLWVSVQELAKDPGAVNMNSFVTRSNEFLTRAQAVYEGLMSYQQNMNNTVKTIVEDMNKIGDRIVQLNKDIVKIEAGGREHANDLRDQRNLLLDELGSYGNITYEEDRFGLVTVQFEGCDYITSDHCNHIGLDIYDSPAGFYTPYWEYAAEMDTRDMVDMTGNLVYNTPGDPTSGVKQEPYLNISNAKVFDLTKVISSTMKTDVGKLRGVLLNRGDHAATYHDMWEATQNQANQDVSGEYYNRKISQSVVMNIQAEFDNLVHNIMADINDILVNSRSNYATLHPGEINPLTGVAYVPEDFQMFVIKNAEDHLNYDMTDAWGKLYKDANGTDLKAGTVETGHTIMNTKINGLLMQEPTLLGFRDEEQQEEYNTTAQLKAIFTDPKYTLNPNVTTKLGHTNMYNALVTQVANSGSVYKTIAENQTRTVGEVDNARTQITGVSSDEELEFMIEFQNAFNASSRYINVISQMLEHLVTTLGRA